MTQKSDSVAQGTEKQSESSSPLQPDSFLCDLHADVEVAEFKLKPKEALAPTPASDTTPIVSLKGKDAQLPAKIHLLLDTPPPESVFSV